MARGKGGGSFLSTILGLLKSCFGALSQASVPGAAPSKATPAQGDLRRFESGLYQKTYDSSGKRTFPEADKFRELADEEAKLRGEAFAESQAAYKRGDKAKAKELSNKGKRHGEAMEQANKDAVNAILAPQQSANTGCIDLHGLYVQEALDATDEFLQFHMSKGNFGVVEIITGAGHHSKNNKAKIKPEVEKLLRRKRLKYVIPKDNDGCIQVTIRAPQ